jgi:DNA polymerase III delta subunit
MTSVYLITGDDIPGIQEEAKKLVDKLTGGQADAFSCEVYKEVDERGPEDVLDDCLGALMTPSLLGGEKTIWLQDFSAFADDNGKAGAGRGEPISQLLNRLAEIIKTEFPPDTNFVVSGPGAKSNTGFAKAVKDNGKLLSLMKPDITKGGKWRGEVMALFKQHAVERQLVLDGRMLNYLVEVVGADTGRIPNELEKVLCYAGTNPTLEQVQEICIGNREAAFFAMTDALGKRDINAVFTAINQLVDNARNNESVVIGLSRQAGSYFQNLIDAKLLMAHLKVGNARALEARVKSMSSEEKETFAGNALLSMHPYRAQMLAEQASRYGGQELLRAVHLLAEAGKQLVSTSLPKRLVLENLAIQIVCK